MGLQGARARLEVVAGPDGGKRCEIVRRFERQRVGFERHTIDGAPVQTIDPVRVADRNPDSFTRPPGDFECTGIVRRLPGEARVLYCLVIT